MRKLTFCLLLISFFVACNSNEIFETPNKEIEDLELTYAEFLNHKKEPEQAYPLLEKLKEKAQNKGNNEYLAKYYAHYAVLKKAEGEYGEATSSYTEALELYGQNGDVYSQGLVYLNLGSIYYEGSIYERALFYYEKAEQAFYETENKEKLASVYLSISRVYIDKKQFFKAEVYLKQGIDIAKQMENKYYRSKFLTMYGMSHFVQEQFSEARRYYDRALEYSPSELQTSYIYGNIAETYIKDGNIEEAEKWLSKAFMLKNKIDGADLRPNINYSAEIETLKGNYQKALALYNDVLTLSKNDLGSKELDLAITSIEKLQSLDNSLPTEVSHSKNYTSTLYAKYKFEQKFREEMEIHLKQVSIKAGEDAYAHKVEMKKKEVEAESTNLVYIATIVVIFIGIGVAMFFYRKKLKKEKNELKKEKNERERLQGGIAGLYQELEEVSIELNIKDE